MKKCTKCQEQKPLDAFPNNSLWCRECSNNDVILNTPVSRAEQLQEDLFYASRAKALFWSEQKFKWQAKAFYQVLLLGCLDRVYRYPPDYPLEKLRGKEIKRFAWRIGRQSGKTEGLSLAALYLGICKPITENAWVSKREGQRVFKVKVPFKRGAKIIMASADADKAKTVFDRVMKFLNECPEYAIAMEQNVIKVKKHPFPSIEINVDGWKHPAEIVFRGPGAKGQALRSKTFDYKLYDEADYMPDTFFDAELATEINAKDQTTGESNAFIILSSTPSGRRAKFYDACFAPDARVALADGSFKAISDVLKGDMVLNRYGTPEPVTRLVRRLYTGEMVTFRVGGLPDEVRATGLHEMMSVGRPQYFCENCSKVVWEGGGKCEFFGSHKAIPKATPRYTRIGRLRAGDFLAVPRILADVHVNRAEVEAAYPRSCYWGDDFVLLPIIEHEITNEKLYVHNLQVGKDHSYTVNCIGVANCTDVTLGFKEFWFPSWENPNYDEETDRYFRSRMTQTVYDHEIMADWGTVESGVFDWTYFQHVFAYKYKNSKTTGEYEYRYVSLNANDVKQIGMSNMANYIIRRLPAKQPLAKYWFGADLGYSADPSEFVVFEEFNGVMKMVVRLHLEHIDYHFQADMVALLDKYYGFQQLGIDEGGNGRMVCQILMSNSEGWNKFAQHRFDIRLTPIPFGGMLVIDKLNGKEIKEPSKKAMTEMIKKQAEISLLIMPGLDYDKDIENQFRNHTYSMGANGQPVYSKGSVSPDHCLVPGTRVATEHGDVPIENVKVGDKVWTRQGLKNVTFSGLMHKNSATFTVEFTNGNKISGTGDHPVFVANRNAFIPIEKLSIGDEVFPIDLIRTPLAEVKEPVPIRVVRISDGPRSEVYDLTVEDAHEFFAEGLLIHNCVDAVRTAFYARAYAALFKRNRDLPTPSTFRAPRW